ncbi:MAG: hypothetical protein GXP59_01885 [Deltaproteobacteria bacterium]|nr:hypothetical protein [Deltaproteobacteria bacterium]
MKNDEIPEINLNSLLDRIQTEGVQKAESEAVAIIKAAHGKADLIIAAARQEARAISEESEAEMIKRREASSTSRLTQTGRDVVLNVKGGIIVLIENILRHKCRSFLKDKNLEVLILRVITSWQAEHKTLNLEILVNEQERQSIFDELISTFQQQAENGIEVKGHPDIAAGFRFGIKGSHLYYDFTDQAIAETIAQYLRPELAALLVAGG